LPPQQQQSHRGGIAATRLCRRTAILALMLLAVSAAVPTAIAQHQPQRQWQHEQEPQLRRRDLAAAKAAPAAPPPPAAAKRAAGPPPGVMCPDEPAGLTMPSTCGARCQAEARAALLRLNEALLIPSGLDWGSDAGVSSGGRPVNFTTNNCNGARELGGRVCTVRESVDLLPGDPNAYLYNGHLIDPLPSHCCWSGVVCCSSRNTTALRAPCEPYSVIGVLLQHWPTEVRGRLDAAVDPLLTLDRWGLQRLDLSGNYLCGTIPREITRMDNVIDVLLGDNSCVCCFALAFWFVWF
jgi:hypothetical protein